MKKHTKGAITAGVAAALLLGGAGTLAYWSDSAAIGGTSISSGNLSLTNPTTETGWVYAEGNANAAEPVTTIVPGDTIAEQYKFTINADGKNLKAELDTPDSIEATITNGGTPTTLQLPVTATYTIAGAPATGSTEITEANDGQEVIATVEVSFPFGDADKINANDTQDLVASLDDLKVQLTQVNANS